MNFLSFFFQAEDGIRYWSVTGVQTCALPIYLEEYKVPTAADVLPIVHAQVNLPDPEANPTGAKGIGEPPRSEEHTSELQSLTNLVCRLLLEQKTMLLSRAAGRGATPYLRCHP